MLAPAGRVRKTTLRCALNALARRPHPGCGALGASSSHSHPNSSSIASNGSTRTTASRRVRVEQRPVPVLTTPEHFERAPHGIDQPGVADALLGVDAQLLRSVESFGRRGEHFAHPVGRQREVRVSGRCGNRARRQPARSGTSVCGPRCSSGSSMIRQPPGPPRPRSNGWPDRVSECSTPPRRAEAPAVATSRVRRRRVRRRGDRARRRDRRRWRDGRVRPLACAASCPSPLQPACHADSGAFESVGVS